MHGSSCRLFENVSLWPPLFMHMELKHFQQNSHNTMSCIYNAIRKLIITPCRLANEACMYTAGSEIRHTQNDYHNSLFTNIITPKHNCDILANQESVNHSTFTPVSDDATRQTLMLERQSASIAVIHLPAYSAMDCSLDPDCSAFKEKYNK